MKTSWARPWLLLLTLSAIACGDSSGGPTTLVPGGGGDGDDAPDGGQPYTPPDGGDVETSTGMPPEGIVGGCGIDSNKIFEVTRTTGNPLSSPIGIDRFNSRAAIVYVDESEDCTEAIHLAVVEGSADSLEPPEPAKAVTDCHLYEDPAVTWAQEGAWLMAFVDDRAGNEVRAQVYDPRVALSNDGFQISDGADRPAQVAITTIANDRRLVAWTETRVSAVRILARAVNLEGKPVAPIREVASFDGNVGSLTLSQLGKPDDNLPESGVLVGYWSRTASSSEIVVQALDQSGAPRGDARVVRADVGDPGFISSVYNHTHELGVDLSAGAIAYSVAQYGGKQLWFSILDNDAEPGQLWDGTGRPRGPSDPIRLVEAPQKANHPSVARIAQGYAVAYRALPGGDVDRARIRVMLLNRVGELQVSSDVAYTTNDGGPTRILQGSDGRSVIVWSEIDPDTDELVYKAARLPCP